MIPILWYNPTSTNFKYINNNFIKDFKQLKISKDTIADSKNYHGIIYEELIDIIGIYNLGYRYFSLAWIADPSTKVLKNSDGSTKYTEEYADIAIDHPRLFWIYE